MYRLNSGFTLFLSLLVEAIPFLMFGVLVSGLLLLFVDERRLLQILPKHPLLAALAGSCFGFLFPVCECGNVPVARRLIMQGASAPVAVGFLLAAPTINPVVIWATWTAFRDQPEIVVFRVIFSLTIATVVAWVFSAQADLKPFLQPAVALAMPKPLVIPPPSQPPLLQTGTFFLDQPGQPLQIDPVTLQATTMPACPLPDAPKITAWARFRMLLDNSVQELRELGGVLVLGSLMAALIQVAVPRDIILDLGQGPVTSVVAMMTLSGVISICSTVDSFFALSFASTFTSGALLAFLVFGPMFDLKNLGLLLTVFKGRAVFYLFVLISQLAFLLTLFMNFWLS
ncbi:permease [Synechococcales cyanobacterium C]|uniref:Permease n=1 Tax=Petrachloros mirabilis ULC683 TaxID=2781853 RepID=A0A8K2ACA1_9CYAN|nr:permease [Petrachloros mirabilis]NCJ05790.1 permease [Petrachloros mirabilis ULC683]